MKRILFCIFPILRLFPYAQKPIWVVPIGHTDAIILVEFSSDGKYVLSASYEGSPYGMGLLTCRLLKGMLGAALRECEFIDIGELFSYAQEAYIHVREAQENN